MSILFTDGFECFDPVDLHRKWGGFYYKSDDVTGTSVKNTNCAIVTGYDPSAPSQLVSRKGGRSLFLSGYTYAPTTWGLFLPFPKSRTVFLGYALRALGVVTMKFAFCCGLPPFVKMQHILNSTPGYLTYSDNTGCKLNASSFGAGGSRFSAQSVGQHTLNNAFREVYGYGPGAPITDYNYRSNYRVAELKKVVNSNNISCTWTFADSIPMQVGDVYHNANAHAGDFYYYQHGFTLLGSNPIAGNTSWVESRIGSRLDKRWFQQCQTVNPDSDRSYYVNGLFITIEVAGGTRGCWLDDFYLANDECDVNNTFLGPIFVRSSKVQSQGSLNDATLFNAPTSNRGDAVGAEIIRLRSDVVSDTTLLGAQAASFDNPFSSHLTLNADGDTQSFSFHPVPYAGAAPDIKACVLYSFAASQFVDLAPATLVPFVYAGYGQTADGALPFRPITCNVAGGSSGWPSSLIECRGFAIEGTNEYVSSFLNATTLNNCELGFRLQKDAPVPGDYLYRLTRKSLTFYDTVLEAFNSIDHPSRHAEELLVSTLSLSDLSSRDWGGSCYDDLILFDPVISVVPYRELVFDHLRFDSLVPVIDITENFSLLFSDEVFVTFPHFVEETIYFVDSSYGFWVEEFSDSFAIVSESFGAVSVFVSEEIGFSVSDLFDNHLDVSEEATFLSSYVWDGHESAYEYLGLFSFAKDALIETLDSLIDFTSDHFDCHWVELFYDSISPSDSVKTQQWRHEWFMGIIINSWQINPVEDNGLDGYRVGDYDKSIFGGA